MKLTITESENGNDHVFESPFTISASFQDLRRLSELLIYEIEQGGGDLFAYVGMPVTDADEPKETLADLTKKAESGETIFWNDTSGEAPDPKAPAGPYDPVTAFEGRLKYSLLELETLKIEKGRSKDGRYLAIAITDLEKLIAFVEKYLLDRY